MSTALQAISQHNISGAIQRHRMTDAGMRLDRAGGGAASGEGERLPGRLSLFSFFHERKRILTVIQKAVAGNQPHGRKTMRIKKHLGCRKKKNTSVGVGNDPGENRPGFIFMTACYMQKNTVVRQCR